MTQFRLLLKTLQTRGFRLLRPFRYLAINDVSPARILHEVSKLAFVNSVTIKLW